TTRSSTTCSAGCRPPRRPSASSASRPPRPWTRCSTRSFPGSRPPSRRARSSARRATSAASSRKATSEAPQDYSRLVAITESDYADAGGAPDAGRAEEARLGLGAALRWWAPSALAWAGPFGVMLGILLARNAWLFSVPAYEDADMGAYSIQVEQARRFALLVGNYSREKFNHPGPAFL